MKLTTPLLDDWCYLARRLREDEQQQFCALLGVDRYDPEVAARAWANTEGPTWLLLGDDGLPLIGGGFEPVRPGVFCAWLAGTPEAWVHWHAITRVCRRHIRGLFASGQAHRIEVRSLFARFKACRWYMAALKMRFEGVHLGAAADGQDLVTYAITPGRAP